MPKSKRDKRVSLTQTKKKGLEFKQKVIEDVQTCCDKYKHIFLFSVHNMRNSHLKEVRQRWTGSRFYFGKNKVMSLALGRTQEDEYKDNLHKLSNQLRGQTGLLFTNKSKKEVVSFFDGYRVADFARSGNTCQQTVLLDQGPIPEFSHSMEPQLRQLGLPTCLQKGVVTLLKDHTVCEKGNVLTPEQARILKLFGHKMAEFYVTIEGMWSSNGKWAVIDDRPEPIIPPKVTVKAKPQEEDEMEEEEEEEEDDET
ncbi:mRNA turnover protein 4 homolog [Ostrea edulis]|uniref:mRNA turnover protein 4 homolog n=1 Tax=Ostrea edulis TaxID=37623 RepID=UPI0020965F30|nr:mRNA turnover protein 4 homolog [Ostrea edulis]